MSNHCRRILCGNHYLLHFRRFLDQMGTVEIALSTKSTGRCVACAKDFQKLRAKNDNWEQSLAIVFTCLHN